MAGKVIIPEEGGLLADEVIGDVFRGYTVDLICKLRQDLLAACPSLREKVHTYHRYLGYARGDRPNALFIYVSKKRLIWDLDVPQERSEELRRLGFEVKPRNNFQGRSGWLTGVRVPLDTSKLKELEQLALEALQG